MSSYGSDSYDDSQTSDDSYESLSMSEDGSLHSSDWTISDSDSDDETWTPSTSDSEDQNTKKNYPRPVVAFFLSLTAAITTDDVFFKEIGIAIGAYVFYRYKMNCLRCSRSFTSAKRLRQHELAKTCHTECPHCGKNLSSLQRLEMHLKSKICRPPTADAAADKERPWKKYDFGDLECYDCGDLMCRCACDHEERLNKEKSDIDRRFGRKGAYFDDIEGVPWENRTHWESLHHGGHCRSLRDSEAHIWRCLYPLKDRVPRVEDTEEEEYLPYNSCYACKKRFSSRQRLDYHMAHNVCGGITDYRKEIQTAAQKCEDKFDAAHKERIEELGQWLKKSYGGQSTEMAVQHVGCAENNRR